eukprot:TRINITY_DN1028_c1_g1_i10.p1 TRINITY_DN1028_c1_g1~~TRINITY_DN1028_c1_g1_i10.p1  ORF type:complete len:200 (+),score=19.81 TRINITY_DN1028_c1_g1_i10:241-840(+)
MKNLAIFVIFQAMAWLPVQGQGESNSVAAAIEQGDTEAIRNTIINSDVTDLAFAFASLESSGNSRSLTTFITSIVCDEENTQIQDQIKIAFDVLVDNGLCDQVFAIFKEIDELVSDEAMSQKLQEMFISAALTFDCITTKAVPSRVPRQNVCDTDGGQCLFWQKEMRCLKSGQQSCEHQWVCNNRGFKDCDTCKRKCLK